MTRDKKWIGFFGVVAIGLGSIAAVNGAGSKLDREIMELKNQIKTLEQRVQALEKEHAITIRSLEAPKYVLPAPRYPDSFPSPNRDFHGRGLMETPDFVVPTPKISDMTPSPEWRSRGPEVNGVPTYHLLLNAGKDRTPTQDSMLDS
ncbi:MAG: hypothetical protein KC964_27740, partial [Candidatus Omnitrophica bacterium]|nr:hypothetical protein [Candidatus Omnitrophota bacterium]